MNAAQRLKQLREDKSLSQHDLAELTGIPQSNISRYERGVDIPAPNLVRLANTLQVTADYLLGESDDPSLMEIAVTHAEHRLLNAIRRGDKLRAITMIVTGSDEG
jgi:transcriptional regulator with XRE-family HTH domain